MAHKRFFNQAFAFLALALIFALALSACSNPAGPDLKTEPLTETYTTVKGTKTYELTITQSAANAKAKAVAKSVARAAFTPAAGDTYVLKITENGVIQISSGTVKAYSNNKFTLAASTNVSVTFDVTINSSGGITNITGTITVQGGETVNGPGSLTTSGGGGGGGGGSGGGGSSSRTFTSVAEFGTWLNNQPANTKTNPYTVTLKLSSLEDLGAIIKNASNKYIRLDFSGSTFTSIEGWAFVECESLTSVTIPNKRKMTHFTQLQG